MDPAEVGATKRTSRALERGTAVSRRIPADRLDGTDLEPLLVDVASFLNLIYQAQVDGRDRSHAELGELHIERAVGNSRRGGQGFGLSAEDRKRVELCAMDLVEEWLKKEDTA